MSKRIFYGKMGTVHVACGQFRQRILDFVISWWIMDRAERV